MTPGGMKSGIYTPTLTNVGNLAGSTAYQCQYLRVGNTIAVSGRLAVNPTLALVEVQLGISLPIASALVASNSLAGVARAENVSESASIYADIANGRAMLQYTPVSAADQPMCFSFIYRLM